ncbi:hypothetical protein NIES204_44160 (plasmid) [Planktothrix agardhii NIES-204]|jgi:hypothetical protein|nr:hypothetical protein NIES204_44160 [Planktothrix agardhii NIES-204]
METSINKSISREAVIFIPGLSPQEKGVCLDIISNGLNNLEDFSFQDKGEAQIQGYTGKRFYFHEKGNNISREIDIYEAYWQDLVAENKLSNKELKIKVFQGFALFVEWIFSCVWKVLFEFSYVSLCFLISILLMVFWYYGILAIAMTAIGENQNFFGQSIPEDLAKAIAAIANYMINWRVWIIVSLILTFLPVEGIVDQFYFVTQYLRNDEEGISLRTKTRNRVIPLLNNLLSNYEKVTVVAHSFGVIISTDVLADYHSPTTQLIPLRYITLGGTLKFLSYKSVNFQKEIQKCLDNKLISSWRDYYSNQDWFGSKTPVPEKKTSIEIEFYKTPIDSSLLEKVTGKTHTYYLFNPIWIKTLLKE